MNDCMFIEIESIYRKKFAEQINGYRKLKSKALLMEVGYGTTNCGMGFTVTDHIIGPIRVTFAIILDNSPFHFYGNDNCILLLIRVLITRTVQISRM